MAIIKIQGTNETIEAQNEVGPLPASRRAPRGNACLGRIRDAALAGEPARKI